MKLISGLTKITRPERENSMVNQLNLKGQRFVALTVSAVWISECCHRLVVKDTNFSIYMLNFIP